MKIAIIGAGFYGCYLAKELCDKHQVDIYEKNSKLCMSSVVNNQNRLHMGYHYPRSKETIEQIVSSYREFCDEFSDCIHFVPKNIYAVHKESKVDYDSYRDIFNFFNLNHEEVLKTDDIWNKIKNPSLFQGALYTSEGVLNCHLLRMKILQSLYCNKNVNIFCNYFISHEKIQKLKKQYDYVINCTYNCPFLGFDKKVVDIKKENCLIVIMKDKKYKDFGFTIMDGDFCSLYPIKGDIFSLSSVVYTPFCKADLFSFDLKKQMNLIINHNEEYFTFEERKVIDYYFGTKTKIKNDKQDQRGSYTYIEDNLISVLAGKISTVLHSSKEVKNEIFK